MKNNTPYKFTMGNKNETKVSHTPGPWKIYHNGVSTAPYVIYSGEGAPSVDSNGYLRMPGCKYVCKVSSEIIDGDSEDTWFFSGDANARLIASAPDLLKENQELKAERDYWLDQAKNHTVNVELLEALENLLMAAEYSRYVQKSATLEPSMLRAKVLINKTKIQ